MRSPIYTTSRTAWNAMLASIAYARYSVYLEMYIFSDSPQEYDFVSALEERARAGLRVKVIFDAFGSFSLSNEIRARLIRAGVEVLFYRFWLHRTHRKLLVIDERIAFVGGVNVGGNFSEWDDLVIRIRGKPAMSVARSFARAYEVCGGTDEILLSHARHSIPARTKTWFVEHGLGGVRYTLRTHYVQLIDHAEHSISLITPYFYPAPWLVASLSRACKRGVQVEVLLPASPDIRIFYYLNRYYTAMLAQVGATFYLHPIMNHAKAILADGKRAIIGSHNLDALSFERNAESGVWLEDGKTIRALQGKIQLWKERAIVYEHTKDGLRWYEHILALFLRPFRRML